MTADGSRLLALPFALLQEAVRFVGDARSTARLLHCTSKPLAQAAQSHPDLWQSVPLVRLSCQGSGNTLAIDERTGQAIVAGPGQRLRALELIRDRLPRITYAAPMHILSFLPQLPGLRSLTVARAYLGDDDLSAFLELKELESLG